MSSKIVTGQAAREAPGIAWHRVPAAATPVWMARSLPAALPPAGPGDPDQQAALQTQIAELERRILQARQDGAREGEAAGYRRAAAELEPVIARLAETVQELAACRSRFRREAEQDVIALALAIARRILRRELTLDPTVMLGLVKAALDRIDLREVHRLRLHPQDAPAIEQRLRELGLPARLEVVPDPALERGAAVFETARGEMDASMETQLAEISRGLADLTERRR
jgi:flagellar assembly protein FliH